MKISNLKNQVLTVLDFRKSNKIVYVSLFFLLNIVIPTFLISQKNESFLFNPSEIKILNPSKKLELNLPKNLKSYDSYLSLLNQLIKIKHESFGYIDSSLIANNLPDVFGYLPLISSGYQIKFEGPYSKKGIWGLGYLTALNSQLVINSYVDERFNIKLSTKAAIIYLKNLMKLYKDYNWVMLAFITSPNYVANIIKHRGTNQWKECENYIDNRFLKSIELAIWLEKNSIIKNVNFQSNTDYKLNLYTFKENIFFDAVAQYKNIDFNKILINNPVLISSVLPKEYPVYLKKGTGNFIKKKLKEILNFQDSMINDLYFEKYNGAQKTHMVKKGDVLGQIAIDYQVEINQIMKWNNLKNTTIYQGQKLMIFSSANFEPANLFTHKIINEKYFWEIQAKYPYVNMKELCKYNSYHKLKPNQKLKIIRK